MGHNVELAFFGMCNIRCKKCGAEQDISETDIDCDIKTHHPMEFELTTQCPECEAENKYKFRIVEQRD